MKFSILHTSARPDKWRAVYNAWIAAADNPSSVEYVLVIDRRWGFTELPIGARNSGIFTAVWNTGRKCYVDGVNIAAQYATGDVFIVNADDQFPCEHWDTELLNAIGQAGLYPIPAVSGKPDEFVIVDETPYGAPPLGISIGNGESILGFGIGNGPTLLGMALADGPALLGIAPGNGPELLGLALGNGPNPLNMTISVRDAI